MFSSSRIAFRFFYTLRASALRDTYISHRKLQLCRVKRLKNAAVNNTNRVSIGHTFRRLSILSKAKFIFADGQRRYNERKAKIGFGENLVHYHWETFRGVSFRPGSFINAKFWRFWPFTLYVYELNLSKVENEEPKGKKNSNYRRKTLRRTKILGERNGEKRERKDNPNRYTAAVRKKSQLWINCKNFPRTGTRYVNRLFSFLLAQINDVRGHTDRSNFVGD